MIQLTENAIGAVTRFIENAGKPVAGLRIRVDGGGCSGFQYGMKLEESAADDDQIVEIGGLKILIDPNSQPLLDNVTVDFLDGLDGSGFKFENPNATQSCGCGKSFAC
ncbi:MAG: iron-sulfur cluster assembly accessory protein [Oceanospirillaceae bacterium]|uniref:HesB/IscA family protein n=1 Tax=Marinobacterium litorale TaxID=404770 RepID=UPI0003F8118A|nr:iron-sulfur cluster assembly accessory protein [Marinobacterium litorale]MBS99346.1 iron-sulfur cluster assembly accessory protein [Oceanospirillaceae bacterium]